MKVLFKAIRDTLASVNGIRWADTDMGQLDQATPPVSWPCALFSLASGQYEPISAALDTGQLSVEVVVAFRLRERTHSKAVEAYSDEALSHIDTVDAVRLALTGLSGPEWDGLQYNGFNQDKRSDFRVWRLRFSCQHYPPPGASNYTDADPQPGFCVHE
jgi:hypothetical protein